MGFAARNRSILKRLVALLALAVAAGCSSTCDNAGVTVDAAGNIVVRGEDGFISPNSTILRNVTVWPTPPGDAAHFSLWQDYTLSHDGALYVLENTAYYPNLIYRIDLANGHVAAVGSQSRAFARSNERSIAVAGGYAYSVDQSDPVISRADVSDTGPALTTFISGPRTRLRSLIGVAVDERGQICALDSATILVLCYPPGARGDVAPSRVIDLRKLLGYAQGWSLVFDRSGHIVVSGTGDFTGRTGFSVAVIDIAAETPRALRIISGPNTQLETPELAVDDRNDIFVLQAFPGGRSLLVFGPDQRGNVAPRFVRSSPASVRNPFRLAIDRQTDDVAILGANGVALFRGAAGRPPAAWPHEVTLPYRGWSIAFGPHSVLMVSNEFGVLEKRGIGDTAQAIESGRGPGLNLHYPVFIARDQAGSLYVASTDGVITELPRPSDPPDRWRTWRFNPYYGRQMNAFAPDRAGYFYFASWSNDAVVGLEPGGRQTVIRGPKTGLDEPRALAVGGNGALFVANTKGKNILVFARGSAGNEAPIARIEGPATQLVAPQAIALDGLGRLYVFDGPQTISGFGGRHYVRVYSVNAFGNVAPVESYEVSPKCWATNAI